MWGDDFNGPNGSLPSSSNWIFDLGHGYPGGPDNWGTGEIQSYAQNQLMTVKKSAVTVTVAQENLDGIDYLTVRLAYPYQAMLPLLPFDSLSLTGISRIPRDA